MAEKKATPMFGSDEWDDDDPLYHGGIVRISGPFEDKTQADFVREAAAIQESIDRGMAALNDGSSEFAADVEPRPNAPVQMYDFFDVVTGDHVLVWRVACRDRSKHAN